MQEGIGGIPGQDLAVPRDTKHSLSPMGAPQPDPRTSRILSHAG